jgi:hypothetical protein
VGLLAVARWPITMCTSVKPYSLDLFFALALIVAAYHYLKRRHTGWLILLTVLAPLATLSSYPSVFVAGGVSLVLASVVWRAGWPARCWLAAFNLLLVGTFLIGILVVGREQLDPEHGTVRNNMFSYWRDGFPPDNLWLSPWWLLMQTTGRMMAYPTGDAHGGSTATVLLFLLGAWSFARRRRWALLGLLLLPFALNLAAAMLHGYPYGGCCRLSQHLAPAICLLAGCGLAKMLDHLRRRAGSLRGAFSVGCAAIAIFGLVELVLDTVKPYRDEEALWSVKLGHLLVDGRKPADQVVVWNAQKDVESLMRWHLGRYGKKLRWDGKVDWEQLERAGGDLWCVSLWSGPESTPPVPQREAAVVVNRPGWVQVEETTYTRIPWGKPQPVRRCQLSRWTRQSKGPSRGQILLESWPP